jgi:glycosyltransferase involved in cell wall biosynthesis
MGSAASVAHFYSPFPHESPERNLRVLYVIAMYGPEYLGNLIHRELGEEFVKRGHTFDVFALVSAREPREGGERREGDIRVHRAVAAGTPMADALNALAKPFLHYDRFGAGWLALRQYLARQAPYDVILAEGAYPFGAICALSRASAFPRASALSPAGAKLLITAAGGDFIDSRATSYGYGRFRTARRLMRYAFQRAAAVRATTPLVKERVIALGAPPERTHIIPRNIASYCYPPAGVPLDEFRSQARAALDARFDLGNACLIAAVGRLLPIKGFDLLIRALPAILQKVGDTRVLLVGPNRVDPRLGDYQAHLSELARGLGIADKVIFAGAVEHPAMREILAASDVLAVPSVLEGMNKVAVEGAAVGTPAVVTHTAGIADLLRAHDAGEIVAPDDAAALAQGILRVLCSAAVRQEYAARCLVFAAQFSSANIGAQLVALCEQL